MPTDLSFFGAGVWSAAKVETEDKVIADTANRVKALLVDEMKVFIGVAGG